MSTYVINIKVVQKMFLVLLYIYNFIRETQMINQTITNLFESGYLKDISGYEKLYAITEDGRIWSYPKRVNSFNGAWMKLQLFINMKKRNKPHKQYTIFLNKNGRGKRFQVHRIVAQTFILNPENKPQINHLDGNSLNNNVSNLEWSTSTENMEHAIKMGLIDSYSGLQDQTRSENGKKTGAINGMKSRRMFTMTEADCIRKIHEVGKKSCRAIARVYNCSNKTISNICNYKSYIKEIT